MLRLFTALWRWMKLVDQPLLLNIADHGVTLDERAGSVVRRFKIGAAARTGWDAGTAHATS